ncbi:MAG: hypothetical protein HY472_00540 [Candidatus Sungbacteria bacterium]|nr:hypothetical protein [Candidatus Sungbacteria bacterium]
MPSSAPAQQILAIDSIREDVVVLKDGGLRVILICSSVNFALKSSEEQDAIIFQYQNFLNALDFPIQFVIHSRRLNIQPYLESLAQRHREEINELLKIQIGEYTEFIKTFVENTNIMAKTFYAVVPFNPSIVETKGVMAGIASLLRLGKRDIPDAEQFFEQYKNQTWQRVDTVIEGFQRFGIRAVPLKTDELIELFYSLYNPTEFEKTMAVK